MRSTRITALILSFGFCLGIYSCGKDEIAEGYPDYGPQEISLDSVRNALLHTVEVYAIVSGNNEYTLNRVGLCWDTEPGPTQEDSSRIFYSADEISIILGDLEPGTSYYLRAFTAHTAEPSYSNELSFTTWDGSLNDYDGNAYKTVQIGNQGWMAENLKTTHYADGTPIKQVDNSNTYYWYGEGASAYDQLADFDGDGDVDSLDGTTYVEQFAYLYTWFAANNEYPEGYNNLGGMPVTEAVEDVCPDGWRLPSDSDWEELVSTIGWESGKLKADTLWNLINPEYRTGSDEFGFNALPAGIGSPDSGYENLYAAVGFFSSDELVFSLRGDIDYILLLTYDRSNYGASVRCIKRK